MTLSIHQRAGRERGTKRRQKNMLCRRLDRQVELAETLGPGKTRDRFMAKAQLTRDKLRKIDH